MKSLVLTVCGIGSLSLLLFLGLASVVSAQRVMEEPLVDPGLTRPLLESAGKLNRMDGEGQWEPDNEPFGRARVVAWVRGGKNRVEGIALLEAAGESKVVVEQMSVDTSRKRPLFLLIGRAADTSAAGALRKKLSSLKGHRLLWFAWAELDANGSEPVPLTTVYWDPKLFPSPASAKTTGPVANEQLFVAPGRTTYILVSKNQGKSFETFYSIGRRAQPRYEVPTIDFTRLYWGIRTSRWNRKQRKLLHRGTQLYGDRLIAEEAEPRAAEDSPGAP